MSDTEPQVTRRETLRGRGLSLFSGGLDSQLAVCVLREQGVHVEAVLFTSPFFKNDAPVKAAEALGVKLHKMDFTDDILALVAHPPHGFGGALNPCIDCHALMIRRAGELMVKLGYDFVATGEVLNQRPMSQNRRSLDTVEKDAALGGRLLRPLSALLLETTTPEKEGLVTRELLLGLNGRSRKPQMELAARYGLREYPSPAGGCLLTESGFCRKLADLKEHDGFACVNLVWLLRTGRHFRLPGGAKCVLGRDARDNAELKKACGEADLLMHTVDVPGPTLLMPGGGAAEDVNLAAEMCAAYGDSKERPSVTVKITGCGRDENRAVSVRPRAFFVGWML
ncbi:MAG: tRNA 4-thiouridine(8) synthase ThiI [Kiritimatiellae bacterium]|nr:tRNA 4-thiouridine(8) synthase ThiI [Kiritimatiellia bacterium]